MISSPMITVSVFLAFSEVGSRKARTPLLTASTPVSAVQPLANARTGYPGTFRDRGDVKDNPPQVVAFTHDRRAAIVWVEGSSDDDPGLIVQFGVRVPLDGSPARQLPRVTAIKRVDETGSF